MENSRRWSGFVCPDCRLVFRVERNHDGQGVVCPSCRKMLKIPAAGDRTPPLLVARRAVPMEEVPQTGEVQGQKRQRSWGRSPHARRPLWDIWSKPSGASGREDRHQRLWMWAGAAALFAVLVTGTMVALRGDGNPHPPGSKSLVPKTAAASNPPAPTPPAADSQAEAAFLTKAEPMARAFLEATLIEDLLPLVRNPDVAQFRMRRHYPEGKIKAPGMSAFNTQSEILRRGSIAACTVQTLNYDEKILAFVETPQGLKIDWESWVGWSDMSWEDFLTKKPAVVQVFRLMLCPVEYYNVAFANDTTWQSYRLISPDGRHVIYGYAERGSALNAKLAQACGGAQSALTLALKFPDPATSPNQVLIESHVTDGWVLESQSPASP